MCEALPHSLTSLKPWDVVNKAMNNHVVYVLLDVDT